MIQKKMGFTTLLAEDDDDDYLLTSKALEGSPVKSKLYRVKDGQELLDYLLRKDGYTDPATSPAPDLLLLDLNMPKKDGREALKEMKNHAVLRHIPVVVLTTSSAIEDIVQAYETGANSYVRKPLGFDQYIETIRAISYYWFKIAEVPPTKD